MALDPWASVDSRVNESKKGLLDAVAQAGTAGKQAFESARSGINASQQQAVARALSQSQNVTGQNIGTGNIEDAYGARLAGLGSQQAGFESGLEQTKASGISYLEKLGATLPLLQAQNKDKLDTRENEVKRAIELAKLQAEQDAAEAAAKEQAAIDRENRTEERAIAREERSAAKAAAKEAIPSLDELLGAASMKQSAAQAQVSRGGLKGLVAGRLDPTANAVAGTPLTDLAYTLGQMAGVPSNKLAGLYAPSKQSATVSALGRLQPVDATAKALATKYAKVGVTPDVATTILKDRDFTDAVSWILNGADGRPRDEVESILRANFLNRSGKAPKTRTYEILVGEYLDSLPTIQSQVAAAGAREKVQ